MAEKKGVDDDTDPWSATTWEGNAAAHLEQVLASSYEARFLWLCEAFEFLKDSLPNKSSDVNAKEVK